MKQFILFFASIIILSSCTSKSSKEINSTTLLETTESWNGNTIPQIKGQPKVTISKVTIPPKQKLPKHIHPVITTGFLLKGELTITDHQNKQITIHEGDVLVEVSNTIHFGQNTGDIDAEILVFYVGEENSPVTILPQNN